MPGNRTAGGILLPREGRWRCYLLLDKDYNLLGYTMLDYQGIDIRIAGAVGICRENASFCPHCAQFTRPRKEAATPIPLRKKALLGLLLLAVLAAVGAGLWLSLSPKSYDGYGEVRYRDYQLLLSQFSDRYVPSPTVSVQGEPEGQYRMPARLFINNSDGQE